MKEGSQKFGGILQFKKRKFPHKCNPLCHPYYLVHADLGRKMTELNKKKVLVVRDFFGERGLPNGQVGEGV